MTDKRGDPCSAQGIFGDFVEHACNGIGYVVSADRKVGGRAEALAPLSITA
jgi:hypothetical protein